MTIYSISIINTTGFPYYNRQIKSIPDGLKLYLWFFDFSEKEKESLGNVQDDSSMRFELTAGLISALFQFAKNLNKKIKMLEFKTKSPNDAVNEDVNERKGRVLITVQTETYLLHNSINEKIKLIYDSIILSKIPLDSSEEISESEEDTIVDILNDSKARNHVIDHLEEITYKGNELLNEMKNYGLGGIAIASFDLSLIAIIGEKYSIKDVEEILRNIGFIPEISSLEWIHRQSFLANKQIWACIINSGIGVTVEEKLFEPYFYLLITEPNCYLGEFPTKLLHQLNKILG